MSNPIEASQAISPKTLVYATRADARCTNSNAIVRRRPQRGETAWINDNGQTREVVGTTGGIWRFKDPAFQSAPPFAAVYATG